jgi:hypothetical protein
MVMAIAGVTRVQCRILSPVIVFVLRNHRPQMKTSSLEARDTLVIGDTIAGAGGRVSR